MTARSIDGDRPGEDDGRRPRRGLGGRLANFADERLGGARFVRQALRKVFPDHFSFMIGEIALYSFLILVLTGIFLTLFFEPSSREVVYRGSYGPLEGQEMSAAYESVIRLSWDVRGGLLVRQIHHWAALVFLAAIVLHLCRVFFTGAFRKPREINWMVGVTLLILAIVNGFAGYSLLDDLLSGTGVRIMFSVIQSVPLAGDTLAFWIFGGEYPGARIISRLFVVHVLIVPALITVLLGAHLAMIVRQRHSQFPGPRRTEHNVVGSRLWPGYAARSVALLFAIAAVLVLLGGLVQINPVWIYGPYDPAQVTTAAQPDWYMGWLEGALRLMPPWEIRAFGHTVPNLFFPAVALPGITFGVLYAYPFIEARFTGDRDLHQLLDRPRERPMRSAVGAAVLTFYLVLFLAGSQDVVAARWDVSVGQLTQLFRIAAVVLPPVVGLIVHRWCRDLLRGEERSREAEESAVLDESAGAHVVRSRRLEVPVPPSAERDGNG